MECVVVQDLFLNETATYAHVFLPGSSFLEKDGTFTNAERRISRVRKAMPPMAGMADWEVTHGAVQRARLSDELQPSVRDHGRDRAADADLRRRHLRQDRRARQRAVAVQREGAGRHAGHACRRLRARQGQVRDHRVSCRPTSAPGRASRCILTTGRILSQYNVGAQTRRTDNNVWHDEDVLEIHPHDAENRGIRDGDLGGAGRAAPARRRCARASPSAMQPGVVYTTFHHPEIGRQRGHHGVFRLGDELPRIQGDGGRGAADEP